MNMCKVNIETIEDSKVLWDLVWRMKHERVNCKMTSKEREVFDKYGITRQGSSLYANDVRFFCVETMRSRHDDHIHGHRWGSWTVWRNINLCDMAIKATRSLNKPIIWDYSIDGELRKRSANYVRLSQATFYRKSCKRQLAMADDEYTKDCKRAKENYLRACESALDYYNRQIKWNTEDLEDAEEDIKELIAKIKSERKTA